MRVDTAVYAGYQIPPNYDSMIMKVIVHDKDRASAITKLRSTLGEVIIDVVRQIWISSMIFLQQKDFIEKITTDFIPKHYSI